MVATRRENSGAALAVAALKTLQPPIRTMLSHRGK